MDLYYYEFVFMTMIIDQLVCAEWMISPHVLSNEKYILMV